MSIEQDMNRRGFMGRSAALGIAGAILGSKSSMASPEDVKNITIPDLNNPRDVRINVKVVYYALIHSGIWEGPCRYRGGGVGPEMERAQNRDRFANYVKHFKSKLSRDANMLEPVYFEFPEFVKITRNDLVKLEADKEEVDLYIVTGTNLSQYLASKIGDLYEKPVAHGRDTAAYLRSKGLEGYVAGDYGGLDNLISLLRARKAFRQTSMLLITDIGIPGYPVTSSVRDFEDLRNRFGIRTTTIPFKELSDERDRIIKSKSSMEEVDKLNDKLIRNAQGVHIGSEQLKGDVILYYAVKNLMKKYDCNAFTIECFEFCGSRLADRWKVVPCLTHSLLRDEGYPSACEGDLCALLALDLFMALTKRSSYMGNMNVTRIKRKRSWVTEQWVKGAEMDGDTLWVGHNVPGLKMLGFDKPDLPYEIRNFINAKAVAPGWGASLKVDFTKIEEKTVTIARFDPLATKMLVTKGEVVGMRGFDNTGCCLGAIINVEDPRGYEIRSSDYGHHFTMTYGDYTQELAHLADMLNIELELHNC